jgi:hypothetical protein
MTAPGLFHLKAHQRRGRLWRFTVLLFSLLQAVWGQTEADLHQATAQPWANLEELKPAQKIRVNRTNAESVASRFVSVTEEGLVVQVKQGPITIPRSQITEVTEPSRGKRLRNILIGLAAGGGIGAAVARRPLSSYPRGVPLGAAVLILAVGGELGAVMPAERTVYRSARNASRTKR